jgi:hypothetical protein
MTICQTYKALTPSFCSVLHYPVTPCPLAPDFSLSTQFSHTLSRSPSLCQAGEVSYPHKKRSRILNCWNRERKCPLASVRLRRSRKLCFCILKAITQANFVSEQRGSTFNNSTFSPHTVFTCFVWISEQTAIIYLYNIN